MRSWPVMSPSVVLISFAKKVMTSSEMFPTVFKTDENRCRRSRSNKVQKRHFFIPKFVIDTIN